MSQALPSACACPTPVTVNVPGSPGAAGTNGTNGVNAFSIVQSDFFVPDIAGSVSVILDTNAWMVVGQNVYVFGAGYFAVNSVAGATVAGLTYLNYGVNTAKDNPVTAGSKLSPSGTQPTFTVPLTIALGGTGGITRADAQSSLGVGQADTNKNLTSIGQTMTDVDAMITGMTLTAPASGTYMILAQATIDFVGAYWNNDASLILNVKNITQNTTISTAIKYMRILGNQYAQYGWGPAQDYLTPFLSAALASGDVLELTASISAAPTSGRVEVSSASLSIVPLALS